MKEIANTYIPLNDTTITTNPSLTNKDMNITEKFKLFITPEPKKSFRKAHITNGDDFLTDEGQRVFLVWLLNKHADEFKTDIVDGILAESTDNHN